MDEYSCMTGRSDGSTDEPDSYRTPRAPGLLSWFVAMVAVVDAYATTTACLWDGQLCAPNTVIHPLANSNPNTDAFSASQVLRKHTVYRH